MPIYYISLPVPDIGGTNLHITVCFMGEREKIDVEKETSILRDFRELGEKILPLNVSIGGDAMFGDKNDIPVKLVNITDDKKRKLMDDFFKKYKDPVTKANIDRQSFHVTTNGLSEEDIKKLTGKFDLYQIEIRQQKHGAIYCYFK